MPKAINDWLNHPSPGSHCDSDAAYTIPGILPGFRLGLKCSEGFPRTPLSDPNTQHSLQRVYANVQEVQEGKHQGTSASISLCLLVGDPVWPGTSHSRCHRRAVAPSCHMGDYAHQLQAMWNPSSLKLLLSGNSYGNEKSNYINTYTFKNTVYTVNMLQECNNLLWLWAIWYF